MPRKIANSTLNASTVKILNTIRANADPAYQSKVPAIDVTDDIPKVGAVLYGDVALANEFLTGLINRIALTRINAAVFNNAYTQFKKGYLEFGETVEEVFVKLTKARPFSTEKAAARELAKSMPDVKTAFHVINWKVQYPVTITMVELNQAFLSANGVQDLVAKIINQVYTSANYDEYLLFKYLLIKAVSHQDVKILPVNISGAGGSLNNAAKKFRKAYNDFPFMHSEYNSAGVTTATDKNDIFLFMDTDFNAEFDVDVLARAFNMEKADFLGKTTLIDDWTTFDNDRFSEIMKESTMIEEVTAEELLAMKDIKAVMLDKEWFQFYDNLTRMDSTYVSAGMYWNYFYSEWKTVSTSPFSNIVAFKDTIEPLNAPTEITAKVTAKDYDAAHDITVFTLEAYNGTTGMAANVINFNQTEAATTAGVAVHKYGAVIMPASSTYAVDVDVVTYGTNYHCASPDLTPATTVGTSFTCTKVE